MSLALIAGTHARITQRQKALWIAVVPLTAFAVLLALTSPAAPRTGGPADLAFTGQMIALFTGVAYAAAFSDFFAARNRAGMYEVEASTPIRPLALRAARVLGTFAMVVVPALVSLLAWAGWQSIHGQPFAVLTAVAVTVTILAPAGLIAMSLSALLGAMLPRGFARIAAVLVWLWLVFSTPLIPLPSLNGTVLNVVGDYTSAGFFGGRPIYDPSGLLGPAPTPWLAVVSLLWQLILILALLTAASRLADARRRR
ncbi:hypothetical protein [Microbacterium lacticum]